MLTLCGVWRRVFFLNVSSTRDASPPAPRQITRRHLRPLATRAGQRRSSCSNGTAILTPAPGTATFLCITLHYFSFRLFGIFCITVRGNPRPLDRPPCASTFPSHLSPLSPLSMEGRGRYFQEVVTAASDYRSEAAASSRYVPEDEHNTPLAYAFSSSPSQQHLYPHAQGPSVAVTPRDSNAHVYGQPRPTVYGPERTGGGREGRHRPLLQPLPLPRHPFQQQRHNLPHPQPHTSTHLQPQTSNHRPQTGTHPQPQPQPQPQAQAQPHVYGSRPLRPQSHSSSALARAREESRQSRSRARPARRAPGGFDSEDEESPPGSPRAAAERNGWDDGGWLPFGAVLSPQAGPQKLRTSKDGWRLRGWEVIFWHVLLLLAAVASLAALALPDWLLTDSSNTAGTAAEHPGRVEGGRRRQG